MCIYTGITTAFAVLFLFNNIFIVNAVNVRNKNNAQNAETLLNEQQPNPWRYLRLIFGFPLYHGSGVYHDLGRAVEYFNQASRNKTDERERAYYRIPSGKCPIFGKVLKLSDNFNFNTTTIPEDFSHEKFIEDLNTGNLPGGKNANGLILPAEQISKILGKSVETKYGSLKSVETKSNIFECADYAGNFDHPMHSSADLEICQNKNNRVCFKHPFIYDLLAKKCYILFPLWQEKRFVPNYQESFYRPFKSMNTNFFVFGTSNIRSDWKAYCPSKPIKGAAFGVWSNNQCNKVGEVAENISFDDCVKLLFALSPSDGYELSGGNDLYKSFKVSKGRGINYANWHDNKCEIIKQQPDCFYYSRHNYGLMSVAMNSLKLYDIVPCNQATQDWEVDVHCGSNVETFKCKNKEWINDNNNTVEKCDEKTEELFKQSIDELTIKENKVVLPKTISISKKTKSGGVKSWKNGGIISSVFFLIICFAL